MPMGTCEEHGVSFCDICQERCRQEALVRIAEKEARAQTAHEGLPLVLVEWEPQSRQNDNAWSSSWPVKLWLLTQDEFDLLPDGTIVTSIHAERKTKGVDYIDNDSRIGMLAWGLMDTQLPPRSRHGQVVSSVQD